MLPGQLMRALEFLGGWCPMPRGRRMRRYRCQGCRANAMAIVVERALSEREFLAIEAEGGL